MTLGTSTRFDASVIAERGNAFEVSKHVVNRVREDMSFRTMHSRASNRRFAYVHARF